MKSLLLLLLSLPCFVRAEYVPPYNAITITEAAREIRMIVGELSKDFLGEQLELIRIQRLGKIAVDLRTIGMIEGYSETLAQALDKLEQVMLKSPIAGVRDAAARAYMNFAKVNSNGYTDRVLGNYLVNRLPGIANNPQMPLNIRQLAYDASREMFTKIGFGSIRLTPPSIAQQYEAYQQSRIATAQAYEVFQQGKDAARLAALEATQLANETKPAAPAAPLAYYGAKSALAATGTSVAVGAVGGFAWSTIGGYIVMKATYRPNEIRKAFETMQTCATVGGPNCERQGGTQ